MGVRAGVATGRGAAGASASDARRAILAVRRGAIAQLGERLNGIQKVRGSNPRSSTNTLATPTDLTPRRDRRGVSFIHGQGNRDDDRRQHDRREHRRRRDGRDRIERYDPAAIEPRWQARWDELGLYTTDLEDGSRPRFYLLTMYPTRRATCTSATGT